MALADDYVWEQPTLNQIPADKIDSVLPLVEAQIRSVCQRSRGLIEFKSTIAAFKDDALQLWIVWNGGVMAVGATELSTCASGLKICTIRFLTGENSLDWLHTVADLEAWAKHQGCDRVVGYMRKGWAKRLSDYKLSHVYLEKDLV